MYSQHKTIFISKMKKLVVFFFITWSGLQAHAQTARDSVHAAVQDYLNAFYYGDSSKIVRSLSPSVSKSGFYKDHPKAPYQQTEMSFQEMLSYVASVKKNGSPVRLEKAPRKIDILDVQDQTASAKLTAWWGTDYILLGRTKTGWKISHVLWQSPPAKK